MAFVDDDGVVWELADLKDLQATSEEASQLPPEMRDRARSCIDAGGVFVAVSNQCCDSSILRRASEGSWKPGDRCTDPLEIERTMQRNQAASSWAMIGLAAGAVAVGGLGWWWWKKRQ